MVLYSQESSVVPSDDAVHLNIHTSSSAALALQNTGIIVVATEHGGEPYGRTPVYFPGVGTFSTAAGWCSSVRAPPRRLIRFRFFCTHQVGINLPVFCFVCTPSSFPPKIANIVCYLRFHFFSLDGPYKEQSTPPPPLHCATRWRKD